ncbi:hypothetical protein BDW42DRAFT_170192 [Aspergillus taichungensis]|uniref:Uncharacterized protein n=1 Tax=Aspergillus taichungensis TaxID=482145 RepID=A0A2J5HTW3_9EURO|nr:hypothetical protein BDW42DRAFT_170192 [Aspergillus taichungensis]
MGRVGRSKVWRWRQVVNDVHGLLAVNVSEVLFICHILRRLFLVIVVVLLVGVVPCKADENKKNLRNE